MCCHSTMQQHWNVQTTKHGCGCDPTSVTTCVKPKLTENGTCHFLILFCSVMFRSSFSIGFETIELDDPEQTSIRLDSEQRKPHGFDEFAVSHDGGSGHPGKKRTSKLCPYCGSATYVHLSMIVSDPEWNVDTEEKENE